MRAGGDGGGGGPGAGDEMRKKSTGVGGGVAGGIGSQFSLSSQNESSCERGNGMSGMRGEAIGVLFGVSTLTANGVRFKRCWLAGPRGTDNAPLSTKILKLRLRPYLLVGVVGRDVGGVREFRRGVEGCTFAEACAG